MNRPRRIVWYPFLAACYPIAALAQSNGGELVRPGDLLRPFLIALCAAGAAWLVSRLVTPDVDRRAFLTFVAAVIFSTFARKSGATGALSRMLMYRKGSDFTLSTRLAA